MILIIHNIKEKKRRGISTVISSLFMLAIVTAIGSVLMIQGVQGVTSFNNFLAIFSEEGESESVHENIVIEHVRFDPTSKKVEFWLRNTGIERVGIDRITMVNVETQDLIINKDFTNPAKAIFGKELLPPVPDGISISGSDVTLPTDCTDWNSTSCANSVVLAADEFRISVTSARGNSFETIATPFNT